MNLIGTVWRHTKSQKIYTIIGECRLEASNEPAVLYTAPQDRVVWARGKDQFLDGRFKQINILNLLLKEEVG